VYFSRAPIPFDRDGAGDVIYHQHVGVYAYSREALDRWVRLAPVPEERWERLEQLRPLLQGIRSRGGVRGVSGARRRHRRRPALRGSTVDPPTEGGESVSSTKYIFVTGGVVSSPRQGYRGRLARRLLVERGLRVTIQKFDPYINVDPGTMSPFQHGEVYVTDDGAETDLDLGHYERFIDRSLSQVNNVTTGRIYCR